VAEDCPWPGYDAGCVDPTNSYIIDLAGYICQYKIQSLSNISA
jgi:hypothetical protein